MGTKRDSVVASTCFGLPQVVANLAAVAVVAFVVAAVAVVVLLVARTGVEQQHCYPIEWLIVEAVVEMMPWLSSFESLATEPFETRGYFQ